MWPQVPKGEEVDGVLAVDAEALWHIMKVTGPVTVNGTTYTPKTVRYTAERSLQAVPQGPGRPHRSAG